MKNVKKFMMYACCTAALLWGGCQSFGRSGTPEKFDFFFCWGVASSEKAVARYAEAGVTDIIVRKQKEFDLALKYKIRAYWHCFTPAGPWPQVMTPEETKHYEYISGKDLDPKMARAERRKIIHQRRKAVQHRYGGEAVAKTDTQSSVIPCFISDEGLVLSKKKIDLLLAKAPAGVTGTCLDFLGYTNHQGCYCKSCIAKYKKYLKEKNLADNAESKKIFYREKLVDYYNAVTDYIKSKRPEFKVLVHIYPDFRPDHLYGNRVNADYCGQTVSWYFQWDESKIRKYTQIVLNRAKEYHSFAEGIPFIGLSTDKSSSLGYKTPETVEAELKTILASGGRTLMVCNGADIITPGYFEVFKKYCGRE